MAVPEIFVRPHQWLAVEETVYCRTHGDDIARLAAYSAITLVMGQSWSIIEPIRTFTAQARQAGAAISGTRTDSRLGRIVRLLSENATILVSGTKIAEEIGTSRSAVWRFVQQLRDLGVRVAGHPATGYRLETLPDLLLPEVLAPMLKGTIFGERIHHYFRVGSTNSEALKAAASGELEGSVFLAEEQTSGRGRGGHGWASHKSTGIYCSVVLRPELSPADILPLSLAAGLAAGSAIAQVTTLLPDLRWPNDVLLGNKKVCGILTEMNAEPTRVHYVVVGIGINVNEKSFPASLAEATSLRIASGREWSRVELTAALLKSLDREYRTLVPKVTKIAPDARPQPALQRQLAARVGRVIRRFEQRSSLARGRRARVEENGGYEGVTEGLDASGFLRIRTAEGLRIVLSGGVRPIHD